MFHIFGQQHISNAMYTRLYTSQINGWQQRYSTHLLCNSHPGKIGVKYKGKASANRLLDKQGSKGGAVASHQCVSSLIPRLGVVSGMSFLGSFLWVLQFSPIPQKPTFYLISMYSVPNYTCSSTMRLDTQIKFKSKY